MCLRPLHQKGKTVRLFPFFFRRRNMQQTIVIGQVLKPQGVRGEVKVKPLLDDIADIKHIPRVTIAGKEYKVLSARCDASFAYLGLAGVPDRDAAELLRGKDVEAAREDVPAPPEGRFYIVDVIGCTVCTAEGETLGKVTNVLPAKTDIFVMESGGREWMFPAADGVIAEIDVEKGAVTVDRKRFGEVAVLQGGGE